MVAVWLEEKEGNEGGLHFPAPAMRLPSPLSRGSILTRQSAVPSHSLTLAHFLPNWIVRSLNDGSSS